MYREIVIFLGILGVFLSLFIGIYFEVAWQIVAVLVTVSIGIPSLVLKYEKAKPKEIITQRRAEIHELPTPLRKGKKQTSALLLDTADITKLNIDDSLLDSIYEQAHRKAIEMYHDAQLSRFVIQVYPFQTGGNVNIYLHFYSKWAKKRCCFAYFADSPQVKHLSPDKRPKSDFDRNVFTSLPWKTSPQWMQFLKRAYTKIRPLTPATKTVYHLTADAYQKPSWYLRFDDGFTGNDYAFEWDGRGLDENSIKQTS